MHDIGKLAISDEVLRKEGELEPEELDQIRQHPTIGARILLRMAALREAIPYVLYHHERWDGTATPPARRVRRSPSRRACSRSRTRSTR